VFNSLGTYADVRINDSLLLRADNMFREWRVPCKTLLREVENGYAIRLRTDRLAKNVVLSVDETRGFFTDN
jgi:beta-mannosidase